MEDDKHSSNSDKDRKMAARFTAPSRGGGYEYRRSMEVDDDDDEKKKKKIAKKAAKKISFIGRNSAEVVEKPVGAETASPEKKSLFNKGGFLKGKEFEIDEPSAQTPELKQDQPEKQAAISDEFQEVVVDRLHDVESELEQTHSIEDAEEIVADADYLGHVGERLDEGVEPREAIEDALEDIYALPHTDAADIDLETHEFFDSSEPVKAEEASEVSDAEEDDFVATKKTSAIKAPASPPVVPIPVAPRPPIRPVSAPISPAPRPYVPRSPDVTPMNDVFYRDRRTGNVIASGALGFMLGRRSGRSKAERELEPEISSRDKEIGELKTKLTDSEAVVRTETAKKLRGKTPVESIVIDREAVVPVSLAKNVENVNTTPSITIAEEKQIVVEQERQFEAQLDVTVGQNTETSFEATEDAARIESTAEQLVPLDFISTVEKSEPEKDMIDTTESLADILEKRQETLPTAYSHEKPKAVVESQPEKRRDVRTLSMPELLQIAESISLEKTSLRELYERQRIDAVNLRRVIIEYMNGGSRYKDVLHSSLEAVEMQRELRGEIRRDTTAAAPSKADDTFSSQTTATPSTNDSAGSSYRESTGASAYDAKQRLSSNNEVGKNHSSKSQATAIVLGILTGIIVMIAVLLYSNSI